MAWTAQNSNTSVYLKLSDEVYVKATIEGSPNYVSSNVKNTQTARCAGKKFVVELIYTLDKTIDKWDIATQLTSPSGEIYKRGSVLTFDEDHDYYCSDEPVAYMVDFYDSGAYKKIYYHGMMCFYEGFTEDGSCTISGTTNYVPSRNKLKYNLYNAKSTVVKMMAQMC